MKVASILIIIIAMLLGLFVVQRIGTDREEQFFARFDSTSINGKLEYTKIRYHLCAFKVERFEEEFYFDPIASNLNDKKMFEYLSKKGDLIVKKAYSDTLVVIQGDKIYMYEFRKPSDR
jgi:hypothetical protein